ncbi:hypothetical protein Fmac_011950 [Flemingia macrophylla]|uniref:Uncharacterized protein n=1 Tax=Flemingia macrophylla TaxID=520843 RepID=A0ABD1MNZ0_9FABA
MGLDHTNDWMRDIKKTFFQFEKDLEVLNLKSYYRKDAMLVSLTNFLILQVRDHLFGLNQGINVSNSPIDLKLEGWNRSVNYL